jgi:hypothetical protein
MTHELISPSFLFRLRIPCRYSGERWTQSGPQLGPQYIVPSFNAEIDNGPHFADLRLAWNEAGLIVNLRVVGRTTPIWCRESRVLDSDGLHLWIDTRNTQGIHRASRFCHHFVFLPQGLGRMLTQPFATKLDIHLAKEHSKPVPLGTIQVCSARQENGYSLDGFIPAGAITGFDPQEHPRLGFFYSVRDRELGWQTFGVGEEFPYATNPSLWGTLELVR